MEISFDGIFFLALVGIAGFLLLERLFSKKETDHPYQGRRGSWEICEICHEWEYTHRKLIK